MTPGATAVSGERTTSAMPRSGRMQRKKLRYSPCAHHSWRVLAVQSARFEFALAWMEFPVALWSSRCFPAMRVAKVRQSSPGIMFFKKIFKQAAGLTLLAISLLSHGQQRLPSLPEDHLPVLRQKIMQALELSPTMVIRRAESMATIQNYNAEKTARYPYVGGWSNYFWVEDDRNDPAGARPGTTLNYNFSINQNFYQWGNISRNVRNARIRTHIDADTTRRAYMTLVKNVRSHYLDLIRNKKALMRTRHTQAMLEFDLEEALEKKRQNTASAAEVFSARMEKQRGDLAVVYAENYLLQGRRYFARISGTIMLSEDEIPHEFPVPRIEEDALILVSLLASFLSHEMPENSHIVEAKRNLEIARNNLKNAKNALRPKFSISAGISQSDQDFALTSNDYAFKQLYVGVALSWTLWDSFATRARVKSSLAHIRAAEVRIIEQQQTLIDDLDMIGRDIKRLAMSIEIEESALKSAEANLEYTLGRKERGEASAKEVEVSIFNLHLAQENALYHRANYWNRVSELLVMIEADPGMDLRNAP